MCNCLNCKACVQHLSRFSRRAYSELDTAACSAAIGSCCEFGRSMEAPYVARFSMKRVRDKATAERDSAAGVALFRL